MSKAIAAAVSAPKKVYIVIEHETYEFFAVFGNYADAIRYVNSHDGEDLKILIW